MYAHSPDGRREGSRCRASVSAGRESWPGFQCPLESWKNTQHYDTTYLKGKRQMAIHSYRMRKFNLI